MRSALICAAIAASAATVMADTIVDFNELTFASGDYSSSAPFASKGVSFNQYMGYVWAGWAYSRVNDPTTSGFGNQYAAITGTGIGGSGNYAVAYQDFWTPVTPTITLPVATTVSSVYLTNTTYAALDMADGSAFSKKFGGASGTDPDWFKLAIVGKNAAGATTGSVDFYLADFRSANSAEDYIVNSWTSVDLTSLGSAVKSIEFSLSSSDTGAFGMNTPSYFALDSLSVAAVPEPGAIALLAGTAVLSLRSRRRK